MVTMTYTMRTHLPDGTTRDHPAATHTFVFGVEHQMPSLEKALEGCRAGKLLHVNVPASEVYGEHDPTLIREIPKKGLIRQRLKKGRFYRQIRMGSLVSFKVLEVREDTVLADFNKPMTGITATLAVEVLAVRDATRGEIEKARVSQAMKEIGCG